LVEGRNRLEIIIDVNNLLKNIYVWSCGGWLT
jgi:hypothetical protein